MWQFAALLGIGLGILNHKDKFGSEAPEFPIQPFDARFSEKESSDDWAMRQKGYQSMRFQNNYDAESEDGFPKEIMHDGIRYYVVEYIDDRSGEIGVYHTDDEKAPDQVLHLYLNEIETFDAESDSEPYYEVMVDIDSLDNLGDGEPFDGLTLELRDALGGGRYILSLDYGEGGDEPLMTPTKAKEDYMNQIGITTWSYERDWDEDTEEWVGDENTNIWTGTINFPKGKQGEGGKFYARVFGFKDGESQSEAENAIMKHITETIELNVRQRDEEGGMFYPYYAESDQFPSINYGDHDSDAQEKYQEFLDEWDGDDDPPSFKEWEKQLDEYDRKLQASLEESEDCEVCYATVDKGTLNDVQAGRICNECHKMNQYDAESFEATVMREKPKGYVGKVMATDRMLKQSELEYMMLQLETAVKFGLISEDEIMSRLQEKFGSEEYGGNYMVPADIKSIARSVATLQKKAKADQNTPEWWKSKLSVVAAELDDLTDFFDYAEDAGML